jgi:hypothetical protein
MSKKKSAMHQINELKSELAAVKTANKARLAADGNSSDFDWGGRFIVLNCPQRGDQTGNRSGNRIIVNRVHIRGYIRSLSTTERNCVRVMVVRMKQPDGVVPATADLLQVNASDAVPTTPLNYYTRDRFSVHYDKRFMLNVSTQNGNQIPFEIDIKGKFSTRFNAASTGSGGDIESGAFYLCFWSETDPADSDGPYMRYSFATDFLQ